jgi:alkylation response protein AidB-like acyl-CoA dehydrogenase
MTKDRLAYLRTLCSNATPGPWKAEFHKLFGNGPVVCDGVETPDGYRVVTTDSGHYCLEKGGANELFIAEARTALPEALDYITELEKRDARNQEIMEHYYETAFADAKKVYKARITELEAQVAALEAKRLELEGK